MDNALNELLDFESSLSCGECCFSKDPGMATVTSHLSSHPPDANMNSVTSDPYHLNPDPYSMYPSSLPGSPLGKQRPHKYPAGPGGDQRKHNLAPNMLYREPTRQRDSSPPGHHGNHAPSNKMNGFRPTFESFDNDDDDSPPSPDNGNYRKDRIQNDLLDEICSDIGIRDATDLDIFDFDNQTDQYIIGQTRLPDDLDCLDETISFTDFQPSAPNQYREYEQQPQRDSKPNKSLQYEFDSSVNKNFDPAKNNKSMPYGRPLQPMSQRPITDEQKCASQDVFNSECLALASPTVSSTCPGSHPRPASQGSAADSPMVSHGNYGDDIKQLKKEMQNHLKSVSESPVPSPAKSCKGGPPSVDCRGPPSVECLGRFGPPSVSNDRGSDVSSTTPGPASDDTHHAPSSCMLSSSPERKYSMKPATPGTPSRASQPSATAPGTPKARNFTSAATTMSESSYGQTGQYGNPGMDAMAKDKVMRFLDQPQNSSGSVSTNQDAAGAGPPETDSASSSPPQHVAKKARTINSGNDLLAEMRNRYAFTKGADMYTVPNKHPNIDGTYPAPAPTQGFNGQFSATPKINFADTSCMNNGSGNAVQFNSCSGNNNGQATFRAGGGGQGFYGGQNASMQQQQQPYSQDQQPQQQRPGSGGHFPQQPTQQQQQNMYGSCPNLGPQQHPGIQQVQQAGRPYSPNNSMQQRPGVPVAQPKMSVPQGTPGYNQYNNQAQQHQYQTPSTSPVPGNMYNNPAYNQRNSNMNQSFSAPNTPMKPPCDNTGYGANQGQWNQQQQQYPTNQQNMYNRGMPQQQIPGQQQHHQMNPAMRNAGGMNNMQMRGQYPQQQQPMGGDPMQQQGVRPGMYNNNQQMPQQPQNCRMMADPMVNPQNLPGVPSGPVDTETPVSQHGFMQSIITDKSSAFRSHPLFPLLRDLIIADMNFHTPSFPFQLIANLPQDFDRLLQNYLHRNPPMPDYTGSAAVEKVIMDALKYAHRALIEKIQSRKQKEGYKEPEKPISAIEDFCERFDRAVKNSMVKNEYEGNQDPFMNNMSQPQCSPGPLQHPDTGSMMPPTGHPQPQGHHPQPPGSMMGPPQSNMMPGHHPAMNGMHSQSYTDLTHMPKAHMGPGPTPGGYHHPGMHGGYPDRRANSLPSTPRKNGRLHDQHHHTGGGETNLTRTGSDTKVSTGSGTGTGKSKVLPKESVAIMMDWLRAHQDNPYPNDDEKEMLIQKTKLTINQINYWFTNARRRILPKWALQRYMEQQEKQKQMDSQQPFGGQQAAVGATH